MTLSLTNWKSFSWVFKRGLILFFHKKIFQNFFYFSELLYFTFTVIPSWHYLVYYVNISCLAISFLTRLWVLIYMLSVILYIKTYKSVTQHICSNYDSETLMRSFISDFSVSIFFFSETNKPYKTLKMTHYMTEVHASVKI